MQNNNEKILIEAGLSEEQSAVYASLIEKGPQKASSLSRWTGIERTMVYKVSEQLKNMGLLTEKGGKGTVAVFSANHPSTLMNTIEQKEKALKMTKELLAEGIGQLSSQYNLLSGKPNVQFYEGVDGAIKITEDLPTENKEILSYIDSEKVTKLLPKQNDTHLQNRTKKEITKKIIIPDNDFTKNRAKNYDKQYTEARTMKGVDSFPTAIQIYDNKVSFLTLSDEKIIGIIIEDKDISSMMKKVFNANWENSGEII